MPEREVFRPEIGPATTPPPAAAAPVVHAPELGAGPFTPDAPPPLPPPPATPRRRLWPLALAGLALLAGAVVLDSLLALAAERPLLAALGWAGLALLLLALLATGWREWAALRALESVAALHRIAPGAPPEDALRRLSALGERLADRGIAPAAAVRSWAAAAREAPTAVALEASFGRAVLAGADARALAAVARASREAGVAVMVSPSPAGDLALFTWRALRMLREVALAYGLRPGRAAELRLLRRALAEGALMAGADLATDAVASAGGQWASLAAGRAGEALLGAQRMGRLGLLVIAACRPVPHPEGEAPRLASVLGRAVGAGG
ncbi:YcjF family protein [Roseococcus sp. DSY-14]|uniref:YcjF family protein n=1 Tax=Roseococcus sp. DSY-14 TaxID=3369650 RepID=UPI00387AC711